jgi:hypothetical protein
MNTTTRVSLLILILIGPLSLAGAEEFITLSESNRSRATMGFELSDYDYLINPVYFSKIETTTLFTALDNDSYQFGGTSGFRGGVAFVRDGISPLLVGNYRGFAYREEASAEDSVDLAYIGYDVDTGNYDSITRAVQTPMPNSEQYHELLLHTGVRLSNRLGLALQASWEYAWYNGSESSYSDIYTDTSAPTDSTLSIKGDRVETVVDMASGENHIVLEPEIGYSTDRLKLRVLAGVGFYNTSGRNSSYLQTVTKHNVGGVDDLAVDEITSTEYAGSYRWYFGASTPSSLLSMGSLSLGGARTGVSLTLDSEYDLATGNTSVAPWISAEASLHPDQRREETVTTARYDDAVDDGPVIGRDSVLTSIVAEIPQHFDIQTGVRVNRAISVADNVVFHIGAAAQLGVEWYYSRHEQTRTTRSQSDINADGDYLDVGVDEDTTYLETGYVVQTSGRSSSMELSVPIAFSYSPLPGLTLFIGTETSLGAWYEQEERLTEGSDSYLYEEYVDNLDSDNSIFLSQKAGSSYEAVSESPRDYYINFGSDAGFGFRYELNDRLSVEGIARSTSLEFDEFRLTGTLKF